MSPTKVIARPSGLIDNSVDAWQQTGGLAHVAMFQWDIDLLEWVKSTAGAGGGGGLTDAQLRATPVPVSAAIADWLGSTAPTVGQKAMASSVPVVIASDQSAVPVSVSTHAVTINAVDQVASAPTNATVGVASGAAVAALAGRTGLIVINTSTAGQRISLGLDGAAAVLDSGITLEVGDSWLMEEYDFTTGAVAGIASAASARLSVQEFA